MRNLTQLAQDYLASLPRVRAVPTKVVRALVEEEMDDPAAVDIWIDFHDQFAGYVEPICPGMDAVWGLANLDPGGVHPPMIEIDYDFEHDKETAYISCATRFGRYEYHLDKDGSFWSPSARDFGVRVERLALVWDLENWGELSAISRSELRDPSMLSEWGKTVDIPEATDKYYRYSRGDGLFLIRSADSETPEAAWRY